LSLEEIKKYKENENKNDNLFQIENDFILIYEYTAKDLQFLKERNYKILRFDNVESGIEGITAPFVILEKQIKNTELIEAEEYLVLGLVREKMKTLMTPLFPNDKYYTTITNLKKN